MTELCRGPNPHPRAPSFDMPAGATDTHFHLFGDPSRYGFAAEREYTPPPVTPTQARHLFDTLGIQRCVVVQASVYGEDNRAQLDGAAEIGIPYRAVVVFPTRRPTRNLRDCTTGAPAGFGTSWPIPAACRLRTSSALPTE